jgi:hypothetical protein
MIAKAYFSRSEVFADDMHLDPDETLSVPVDTSQGNFITLTYDNVYDTVTGTVAYYDTNYNCWVDGLTGASWSDVTIHFSEDENAVS